MAIYIKFCTIQMTSAAAIYAGLDTCGNRINCGKPHVWLRWLNPSCTRRAAWACGRFVSYWNYMR